MQIDEFPVSKGDWTSCVATVHFADLDSGNCNLKDTYRMVLYLSRDSLSEKLTMGDVLLASGRVGDIGERNLYDFNYADYLRREGIDATLFVYSTDWRYVENKPIHTLKGISQSVQHRLVSTIAHFTQEKEILSVAAAMSVGDRSLMDSELRQSYANAGAAHILAVSGLHIGIIYLILRWLSTLFGLFPIMYSQKTRRIATTLVVIIGLWIYAFITGLSPSVVRAALMFSLLSLGGLTEREVNNYNILASAAFFTLLINPLALFSISFQLSYGAMVGIFSFQRPIRNLIPHSIRFIDWIVDVLSVTLSAQVGTLPFTLFYFGRTANYFALTNLFVIPAASVIVYTVCLLLLFSWWHWLAAVIGIILKYEVWGLNTVVKLIENLPFSFSEIYVNKVMFAILLLSVAMLVLYANFHRWIYLAVTITCIFAFVGVYAYLRVENNRQAEMYVYSSSKANVILLRNGERGEVLTDSVDYALKTIDKTRLRHHIESIKTKEIDVMAYSWSWDNRDFLLLKDSVMTGKKIKEGTSVKVDYLLVGKLNGAKIDEVVANIQTDTILLLGSMPYWQRNLYMSTLDSLSVPYIDVSRHGVCINKK